MLIVMGDQANLSVGKLFAGAIVPGLILSALYVIYILIRCYVHPEDGPALSAEEIAAVSGRELLMMVVNGHFDHLIFIFFSITNLRNGYRRS